MSALDYYSKTQTTFRYELEIFLVIDGIQLTQISSKRSCPVFKLLIVLYFC